MHHSDHRQPIYQSEDGHRRGRARRPIAPESTLYDYECDKDNDNDNDNAFESPDTFLQPGEICSLTGRKRRVAQVKVLRSMAIEHKVRPDGGIAVLRAHIIKVFDGNPEANSQKRAKAVVPNWLAI